MVRHVIDNGGPIHIGYGSDEFSGMFLSVYDRRLEWQQNATDEVNKMCTGVASASGDGGFLNLYTGISGIGKQVSKETMVIFMQRYGVPEERIRELSIMYHLPPLEPPIPSTTSAPPDIESIKNESKSSDNVQQVKKCCCAFCGKNANLRCVECHKSGQQVVYCSKQCQTKDWSNHKHFCALPFPEKKATKNDNDGKQRSIHAVLIEEHSTKPKIVELPLDGPLLCMDAIFPKGVATSRYYLPSNPLKGGRRLPDEMTIEFRDNFLNDGSAPNKCVRAITGNASRHPWAGPILVYKHQGSCMRPNYADIELADGGNIIDFFKWY